jgi:hypothetical protein
VGRARRQAFVAEFLSSVREFPQRQHAANFNLEDVMKKMRATGDP